MKAAMDKSLVLNLLRTQIEVTRRRFGAKHISVFGSAARDELNEASDIDVLVEFDGLPTFDNYMELKFFLQDLFKRRVDLVTRDSIKPRMRQIIERDLIRVA